MTNQLFESALGITAPWYVRSVDFDAAQRQLNIAVDFVAGSRFGYAGVAGEHPADDLAIIGESSTRRTVTLCWVRAGSAVIVIGESLRGGGGVGRGPVR